MKRHLIIGGTGRAGTSFLVRYFDAIGLETHLKTNKEDWDEAANAGLEDMPLGADKNLPYVIKTPWLYQIIDQLLEDEKTKIDFVVLPIRNLMEAATSRVVLEYQALHKKSKRHADFNKTWDAGSAVKGGVVYSLHPLDEARILAVGFHDLIEKLVENEIPIVFLAFPKFVNDSDYLYRTLKPFLKNRLTKKQSDLAHAKLADSTKIRVTNEIKKTDQDMDAPNIAEIENIALKRELHQLRDELTQLRSELEDYSRASKIKEEKEANLTKKIKLLEDELNMLRNSTSWKVTKPIRKLSNHLSSGR